MHDTNNDQDDIAHTDDVEEKILDIFNDVLKSYNVVIESAEEKWDYLVEKTSHRINIQQIA